MKSSRWLSRLVGFSALNSSIRSLGYPHPQPALSLFHPVIYSVSHDEPEPSCRQWSAARAGGAVRLADSRGGILDARRKKCGPPSSVSSSWPSRRRHAHRRHRGRLRARQHERRHGQTLVHRAGAGRTDQRRGGRQSQPARSRQCLHQPKLGTGNGSTPPSPEC